MTAANDIVWGTNSIWGTNIVWGGQIFWGTALVWGNCSTDNPAWAAAQTVLTSPN
jgi:hypothetical protein